MGLVDVDSIFIDSRTKQGKTLSSATFFNYDIRRAAIPYGVVHFPFTQYNLSRSDASPTIDKNDDIASSAISNISSFYESK